MEVSFIKTWTKVPVNHLGVCLVANALSLDQLLMNLQDVVITAVGVVITAVGA